MPGVATGLFKSCNGFGRSSPLSWGTSISFLVNSTTRVYVWVYICVPCDVYDSFDLCKCYGLFIREVISDLIRAMGFPYEQQPSALSAEENYLLAINIHL